MHPTAKAVAVIAIVFLSAMLTGSGAVRAQSVDGEEHKPAKTAKPTTGPCAQYVLGTAEYKDCSAKVKLDADQRRLGDCAQFSAGSVDRQRCLQARKQSAKLPCDEFAAASAERSQCLDKIAAEDEKKRLGECSQFGAASPERQSCLAKAPPPR